MQRPSIRLSNFTVTQQLRLILGLSLGGFVLCAIAAGAVLERFRVNGPVYAALRARMEFVADALPPPLYIVESYALAQEMEHVSDADLPGLERSLAGMRADWARRVVHWRAHLAAGPEREEFERATTPVRVFFELIDREVLPRLHRGDRAGAEAVIRGPLRAVFHTHRAGVNVMIAQAEARRFAEEAEALRTVRYAVFGLALFVFVIAASTLRAGSALSRRIARPIAETTADLERIAAGDLSPPEADDRPGEISRMRRALRAMVGALKDNIARLDEARGRAEAGQRARTQFLEAMTHELRTPLNGVIGMADLLGAGALDPMQRDQVRTLKSSAEALLRLVDDVLELTHLDGVAVALTAVPFDPREVVDDVLKVFATALSQKGVDAFVRVGPDVPPSVLGDAGRLRRALTNLVGNAVKFTEHGHLRVDLEGAEGELRLVVADTGIGIPAAHLARLFEGFHQVDASSRRRFGGAGVGLAVARRIARAMGGDVTAESVEGEGSRFTLQVRCATDATPRLSVVPLDLGRLSFLVAGDVPAGREILAEYLTRWGAKSVRGLSLAEAVEALREPGAVDLVLVEETLGATLARDVIAAAKRHARVRVALIHDAGGTVVTEGPRPDAVLSRPVRPELLRKAVARLTGTGRPTTSRGTQMGLTALTAVPFTLQVLVAEDDPVNQKVAVALLSRLGCAVDVVPDGRHAVERALSRRYDLCFMDCRMPEVDGFEATEQIRALWTEARRLPIVALTANAMPADRARCTAVGMDDFVAKPIRIDELKRVLRQWTARVSLVNAS